MGFKGCDGVQYFFFIFASGKQSIVTTTSCEAELVCSNVGASYLVWAAQLLEGFRVSGPSVLAELQRNPDATSCANEMVDVPLIYQDNACAGARQLQELKAHQGEVLLHPGACSCRRAEGSMAVDRGDGVRPAK